MDGRCRSIRVSCGSLAFRDRAQACFVPSTSIAPLIPGKCRCTSAGRPIAGRSGAKSELALRALRGSV